MNEFRIIVIGVLLNIGNPNLHCQDSTLLKETIYPAGIYTYIMLEKIALKDQYISVEKYTGNMHHFTVGWARAHEKYVYRLKFSYGFSDQIKNNNARTEITKVILNQGFLYPLKKDRKLFGKELKLFLGPSTDFIYFLNKPIVAVDGFDFSQSHAAILSIGLNADAILRISNKFHVESSLSASILSVAFRSVDSEEDDEAPAKLLTFIKGLNGTFDLKARYYIAKKLSLAAGYEFNILNISAWQPLTEAGDNLVFGLTYRF
jgi:hypothetical protein